MSGKISAKATLWRALRYFVGAIITIVILAAQQAWTGLVLVPVNLHDPQAYVKTLAFAFILGFLGALSKILRDRFGNVNGSSWIDKLPL